MSNTSDNYLLEALLGILPYAENECNSLQTLARSDADTGVEAEEAAACLDVAYEALKRRQEETPQEDQFWMEAARHDDRLCAIPACAKAYGISERAATQYVNHYMAAVA